MFTSLNLSLLVLLSEPGAVLTPALDMLLYCRNLPDEVQIPCNSQVIKSHRKNKPSDQGVKSDAARVTQNICSSLTHPKNQLRRAGTCFPAQGPVWGREEGWLKTPLVCRSTRYSWLYKHGVRDCELRTARLVHLG